MHLHPIGAQLLTPLFTEPHGEPGGSSSPPPLDPELLVLLVLLPPELLLDVEPIPHGSVLPASAEQALFSRHAACSSVGAFEQSASHVADGSSAPHSVAFVSQRLWQFAAAVVVPPLLDPPLLEAVWPFDPVVLDEHPVASTQRKPTRRR